MSVLNLLDKPAYWFRPHQALYRGWASTRFCQHGLKSVDLAWGLSIWCNTNEAIGRAILDQGIYDLVVSEVISRLVPEGGTAVDVGANIGYMAGLMAKRTGPKGHVFSFEPSSRLLPTLTANVARWASDPTLGEITVQSVAVSDKCGTASLHYPEDLSWTQNQGRASLNRSWIRGKVSAEDVRTTTLDEVFSATEPSIDLLKLDVEGHELSVLKGARELLTHNRIKQIVFEDVSEERSAVQDLLESYGYRIYRLSRNFLNVVLHQADGRSAQHIDVVPNYLATLDVSSVRRALNKKGWSVLRRSILRRPGCV